MTPNDHPSHNPELDKMRLEHKIELENSAAANVWQASCMKFDRRCLIFMNQVVFGMTITIFCMFKLSNDDLDVEKHMVYLSLLTTIIGIFLPSPTLRRGD
jgi:hypothetical protein